MQKSALREKLGAESYADKMHGLCRLHSGVKKISLVFRW